MENRIIKLKSMELENFKNVKYGKIEFKEEKSKKSGDLAGSIAHILGIYGQNGSGKTSVINGLRHQTKRSIVHPYYFLLFVLCSR